MNAQVIAVNDEDDPFKDLNADLDSLRQKEPSFVPKDLTAKIVTATDTNVLTRASTIADKEILKEVIIEEIEADDGIDDKLDEEVAILDVREQDAALKSRKEDRECKI